MPKIKYLLWPVLTCLSFDIYAAMDHSGHRGMGGDSTGSNCMHPHLDKIKPERLTTVSPGAEFSFVVFNIDKPEQVSVMVKQQPVPLQNEFKDTFYIFKGKIPQSLSNTAARIDVKVSSKFTQCRLQDGWLIKIAEN